jgi:hypothetical protein
VAGFEPDRAIAAEPIHLRSAEHRGLASRGRTAGHGVPFGRPARAGGPGRVERPRHLDHAARPASPRRDGAGRPGAPRVALQARGHERPEMPARNEPRARFAALPGERFAALPGERFARQGEPTTARPRS